jgi:hypothetical protein
MDQELKEKRSWISIRKYLNGRYTSNVHWNKAVELLQARFNRLYLEPIHRMSHEKGYGMDLGILAMQCALIEVLAAFRTGGIYSHTRKKIYHYNHTRLLFVRFLRTSRVFENIFWRYKKGKKEWKPYNAEKFYTHVRCALMHEARTSPQWRVKSSRSVRSTQPLLEKKNNLIYLNRSVLQHLLKQLLKIYSDDLRKKGKKYDHLRKHFARKMDDWFDIAPNKKWNWWN